MEICISIFYKTSPEVIIWCSRSTHHCYSSPGSGGYNAVHINTLHDMRRSAQRFDAKKPRRMHSCSDPSVPVVIICHLPDRRALLRNALDEVDSRWELALQTQRRDWKVVWRLIVVESLWFCMHHRRQAQLTRRTQSANPPGMSIGWFTVCSPLTNRSIRRHMHAHSVVVEILSTTMQS